MTGTRTALHANDSSRGWRTPRRVTLIAAALLCGAPLAGALVPAAAQASSPRTAAVVHATTASTRTVAVTAAPHIPVGARALGATSRGAREQGAVVLMPRDETGLTKFIAEVTNKKSAMYHRYLARGAFGSTFGPTGSAVSAVEAQLRADGLHVSAPTAGGLLVPFTGTAARVEQAFQTGLASYRLADGSIGQATTSAVHVPAAIAGDVAAVVGLDNLVHPQATAIRQPAKPGRSVRQVHVPTFTHPAGSPTACADATAAAQQYGGLTDDAIMNAYGAFGLYGAGDLGSGQHIAIYELEPFLPSDALTFDTCYFGATQAATMQGLLNVVPIDGGQPAGPGGGEAALDVEDVSATAPMANIDVYEAPNNTFGGIDEYASIISADTDQVITSSWGLCEQAAQLGEPGIQQSENFLFQMGAAQGQTMFAAAGDTGSDSCNAFRQPFPPAGQNPLSALDPSSQPYVLSAGGTTIDDATQPPLEHVWNDGAQWGAGGGGISMSWEAPSWQSSSLVPGIALPGGSDYTAADAVESASGYPNDFCNAFLSGATGTTPCRLVPDVSAQADEFTGAVTIYGADFGGWFTIGGTSSAAPLWAGMLALVNASPTCAGNNATLSGVGFAAPLLYAVASNPASYQASFNDISSGNNDIYGLSNGFTYASRTGYDLASGLGTPQLTGPGGSSGLAFYLCEAAVSATRPVVTSLSPPSAAVAGGTTLTINGSGFETNSTPAVSSVNIGNWQAAPVTVTANSVTVTLPPAADTTAPGSPAPLDGAGPAEVTVTINDGESSAIGPSTVLQYVDENSTPADVPSVSGMSPDIGVETGPSQIKIYGSDFTNATGVTFGGVAAQSFSVVSAFEITATPPVFSGSVTCGRHDPSQTSANDICQSEVVVTNANGSSATSTILPPYEGPSLPFGIMGVPVLPSGCSCEEAQVPTEFDYIPIPVINSVTTHKGGTAMASLQGGSVVTLRGAGFDPLTFDWAATGDTTQQSSENVQVIFQKGDTLQIVAPPQPFNFPPPTQMTDVDLSVLTAAGISGAATLNYAGVPQVTAVATTTGSLDGAPDTGQTPITLTGAGFAKQAVEVEFFDSINGYSVGTQYTFNAASDTSLTTQTVSQLPALVDVVVCSESGCFSNPPGDQFYLFPPGSPKVNSVSPTGGPAQGGTSVTITGENLGCVTGVFFGTVAAETFQNNQAILDCGSTSTVTVTAPPGTAGTNVPVTVTTVESAITNSGPSPTTGNFAYATSPPSAPQSLAVTPGLASAKVTWTAPASTGGDAITSYIAVASTPGMANVAQLLAASATSATFAALQPGVPWTFAVSATSSAGNGIVATSAATTLSPGDNGYLVGTSNGAVFGFGSLHSSGGVGGQTLPAPVTAMAAAPDGLGYWLLATNGSVYNLGDAPAEPALPALPAKAVGIAAMPLTGSTWTPGYWVTTSAGNIYTEGGAAFYGSLRGVTLPAPIVGIAVTPDGGGYWLTSSAGNIYSFGDAAFYGSLRGKTIPAPIVGVTSTPDGHGYWLVSSKGNIYGFGDAGFFGSENGKPISAPIIGLDATPDAHGYWLAGADGAIYIFGTATNVGSPKGSTQSAAVSIAS